ncbi:hypothetical protein [Brevibacillus dissolubilis]|uniref:hypothetical protein n=1 Tax=Brevibacillus dissolubilis TaxID=1844116 RepID=UPI00111787FA|nr:hypothetical protein [Brevibacillus dissolubilis]
MDSDKISIEGNPDIREDADELGLILGHVELNGTTIGKAPAFIDLDGNADRGWAYVDIADAKEWIAKFGGNEAHVLSGSTIYSVNVRHKKQGISYRAYNLADIAVASGGRGIIKGDGLVPSSPGETKPHPDAMYKKMLYFQSTPRPSGSVSTDKSTYKPNETVKITTNATDHSIYDRGIFVWNLSVINKTTGGGYRQLLSNEQIRDINQAGSPPFTWSNHTFTYQPTEPGVYEVSLVITDLHHRTPEGSPSMSVAKPYTAQFTVGNVTPPPDDEDDGSGSNPPTPPAACKIDQSTAEIEVRIEGERSDSELMLKSGGAYALPTDAERMIFTANTEGTFKLVNHSFVTELPSGSGNNRKVGMLTEIGSSFTIIFESDDKRICWQKTFTKAEDDRGGGESCPIIEVWGNSSDSKKYDLHNGDTLYMTPDEVVNFKVFTKDATTNQREPVYAFWRINGTRLQDDNGDSDRRRKIDYSSDRLTLPLSGTLATYNSFPFTPGSSYELEIEYPYTTERQGCPSWKIKIVVQNGCPLVEENRIVTRVYGEPPAYYPPNGEETILGLPLKDVYFGSFIRLPDGRWDTRIDLSASLPGDWFLLRDGTKTKLNTEPLQANQRVDVILPADTEPYAVFDLQFVSTEPIGCKRTIQLIVQPSEKKSCPIVTLATKANKQTVKLGSTVALQDDDFYRGSSGKRYVYVLQEDFGKGQVKLYQLVNGTWQKVSEGWNRKNYPWDDPINAEYMLAFPTTENEMVVSGTYRISWSADNDDNEYDDLAECFGSFVIEVGESEGGENLLILPDSFKITPNMPQKQGTEAVVTFAVKNEGKLTHDTKLSVRWESVSQATQLDVNNFKPGEVRTITVPTKYPMKSETFIAHINPDRTHPAEERNWDDNRRAWPVSVTAEVPKPPKPDVPQGEFDGGSILLKLFDSSNRELILNGDGVWEREPVKIEVKIDQTKINESFEKVKQEINKMITDYKAELQQFYQQDNIKNLKITATPAWIADAKKLAVYNPVTLKLNVSGPGLEQAFTLSSASMGGTFYYAGTTVPTSTTWRKILNTQKYQAEVDGFTIEMNPKINFTVTYDLLTCSPEEVGVDEDGNPIHEEVCTTSPQQENTEINGEFRINVKGGKRLFDVFEPNAVLRLLHEPEAVQWYARDRYKQTNNHYYGGEAVITHVALEERHKHPVSGKYPIILGAQVWIKEDGGKERMYMKGLNGYADRNQYVSTPPNALLQNALTLEKRNVTYKVARSSKLESDLFAPVYSTSKIETGFRRRFEELVTTTRSEEVWAGPLIEVKNMGKREATLATNMSNRYGKIVDIHDKSVSEYERRDKRFYDENVGMVRTKPTFIQPFNDPQETKRKHFIYYRQEPYYIHSVVRFGFGVDKGFPLYQRSTFIGKAANDSDYRAPVHVVGSIYEFQSYRTHAK